MNSPVQPEPQRNQNLPSIEAMNAELEATFPKSDGVLVLVTEILTGAIHGSPLGRISEAFHTEHAPVAAWLTFKIGARLCQRQRDDLDCFARAYLDVVRIPPPENFYPLLGRLLGYSYAHNINVHDFLVRLRERRKQQYFDTPIENLALAVLHGMIEGHNADGITAQIIAVERLRETLAGHPECAEILEVGVCPGAGASVASYSQLKRVLEIGSVWQEFRDAVLGEILERKFAEESIADFVQYCDDLTRPRTPILATACTIAGEWIASYRRRGWDSVKLLRPLIWYEQQHLTVEQLPLVTTLVYRCAEIGEPLIQLTKPVLIHLDELSDHALRAYARIDAEYSRLSVHNRSTSDRIEVLRPYFVGIMENLAFLGLDSEILIRHTAQEFFPLMQLRRGEGALFAQQVRLNGIAEILAPLSALHTAKGWDDPNLNGEVYPTLDGLVYRILFGSVQEIAPDFTRLELVAPLRRLIDSAATQQLNIGHVLLRLSIESEGSSMILAALEEGLSPSGSLDKLNDSIIARDVSSDEPLRGSLVRLFARLGELALPASERLALENQILSGASSYVRCDYIELLRELLGSALAASDRGESSTLKSLAKELKDRLFAEFAAPIQRVYEAKGWNSAPVLNALAAQLNSSKPWRPGFSALFREILDYYAEQQWRVEHLFKRFAELAEHIELDLYRTSIDEIKSAGVRLEFLSLHLASFMARRSRDDWGQVCIVGRKATRLYDGTIDVETAYRITNEVNGMIHGLLELNTADHLFEKIAEALVEVEPTLDFFREQRRELCVHRAIHLLINARTPSAQASPLIQRAMRVMDKTIPDHPPYATPLSGELPPEVTRVLKETQQVFAFGYDLSYGFSAEHAAAMRIGKRRAELAQFGVDCGATVHAVNSRSPGKVPGPGYIISGLNPELIFLADDRHDHRTPATFSRYYERWPWGREIDELRDTTYWATRFLFGITGPEYPRHRICGNHYTLTAVNQQHGHYLAEMLCYVPTVVWEELFSGTLIPIDEYQGPTDEYADINARKITIAAIYARCHELDLPIFNLCSGSCYSGTLVNSNEPMRGPFSLWEIPLQRETRDAWGHVHKSHILTDYTKYMTADLEREMVPMREAHDILFEKFRIDRYKMHIFQIARAAWRKGLTLDAGAEAPPPQEELDEGESIFNPNAGRMLEYAYAWHHRFQEHGGDPWILYKTKATRWGIIPTAPLIDTADLAIFDGRRWQQLPPYSDGTNGEEMAMYRELVLRGLRQTDDIRFLDREFALRD